jgi:hypothetical protein
MANKGDTVNVKDSDGGTTRAKVTKVINEQTLEVKWLEARWNLNANVMVARKGTKSVISASSLA